jgi:Tol biopolymer transport system component
MTRRSPSHASGAGSIAVTLVLAACAASPTASDPGGSVAGATPTPAGAPATATPAPTPRIVQATPTPFADGPWIAYQANGANGYGVQLLPLDGGHGRSGTVAGLGGYQEHPDWSPDGDRFVFTIKHNDSDGELWIADPATGQADKVVDCADPCVWADEPAWSPDGHQIAFQRATIRDGKLVSTIEVLDLASKRIRIVHTLPERFVGLAPRWSADEQQLVIEDIELAAPTATANLIDGTVGVIDLAHPDKVRLLLPFERKANNPDWSPDGALVLFSMPDKGGDPGGGLSDLWTIHPDGKELTRVTRTALEGGTAVHPTFTPDGRRIVFVYGADADAPWTMATVALDGSDLRPAFGDQWVEGLHPRIRPTG